MQHSEILTSDSLKGKLKMETLIYRPLQTSLTKSISLRNEANEVFLFLFIGYLERKFNTGIYQRNRSTGSLDKEEQSSWLDIFISKHSFPACIWRSAFAFKCINQYLWCTKILWIHWTLSNEETMAWNILAVPIPMMSQPSKVQSFRAPASICKHTLPLCPTPAETLLWHFHQVCLSSFSVYRFVNTILSFKGLHLIWFHFLICFLSLRPCSSCL